MMHIGSAQLLAREINEKYPQWHAKAEQHRVPYGVIRLTGKGIADYRFIHSRDEWKTFLKVMGIVEPLNVYDGSDQEPIDGVYF